jgi:hypothetical protein
VISSYIYTPNTSDEHYTPAIAINPILPYIPKNAVIWCPFDTDESQFVKILSKTNRVIYSHIEIGQDFFEYEPIEWDIIVSNPPFKNKRKYFERALSFNKPFALIMTNNWLNDSAPKKLFKEKDLQLLMFDKRIHFANPENKPNKQPPFGCSYFCWNLLPKQIIMGELK